MTSALIVCTHRSPAGLRALRWAADEARRRALPLRVVTPEPGQPRSARHSTFADVLATVRAAVPGLPVPGATTHESLPAALRRLSADATALVLPATLPDLATVVAHCYCPVVTVPAHDPLPAAERGPVVLGAAPWTPEDAIGIAFQQASERKAPLRAVRVWSEPRIDLGRLRSDRIAQWDSAEERARRDLDHAISAWTIIHPAVPVERVVVQDRPVDFLLALSLRAQLLVLGRSARGALLTGIAGSPMDALLRSAGCPVLVVPGDGAPRSTWLPTRDRARALTGL